mmetsp:Transcript_18090/g.56678  ORF Transcript_18090/g.56678 Transcript_18090/m.56678 type:complete len:212 (+) Transcript_18090:3869-4504(+)
MVRRMVATESCWSSGKAMKLKWRRKRLVTTWRPPPGGPMHPTKAMSMILRNSSVLRSYQPCWSIHWRRSSTGGCAPYSSRLGMLTSSTMMEKRLPAGGAKMPLRRFSSLLSSRSWVWLAVVCAEKLMNTGVNSSGIPFMSLSLTLSVLPVPVGPTQSTWWSPETRRSVSHMYRTESVMGTMMSAKGVLGESTNSSMVSSQRTHSLVSRLSA